MISFLIAASFVCSKNVFEQNYVNQNQCELIAEIPSELQNLKYAIYPNSPEYNNDRFIFNKRYNIFPHAIIAPRTYDEMAFVLKSLKSHNLPFTFRCGGHCYEPGSLSSGYIIDMKEFTEIRPDTVKGEVVVGAGCLLGQVIAACGALDYAVPTGDCPVVGVTGLSLGGGQGVLTRALGLTCDSIKSITLMTASGEIVEASDDNNPDLFWALRGAGQNSFGAVLQFTFKMVPVPKVQYVELEWDFEPKNAAKIYQTWQSWLSNNLPNNITTHIRLGYAHGKASVKLSAVKMSTDPLTEWKAPFEALDPKVKEFSGRYIDSIKYWAESHTDPFSKSHSAIIMEPIADAGIQVIVDTLSRMVKEQLAYRVHFTIASMGGQSAKGDTAYFPRKALAMWHQMVTWATPEEEAKALQTLATFHDQIAPYVSKYCYENVVDYDLGNGYLEAYYGDHVQRLIEIKTKWDPDNFFRWKQSIPIK